MTHQALKKALQIIREKTVFRKLMALDNIRKQPFFGRYKPELTGKVVNLRSYDRI